jgi:SnoaL-like domain
MSDREGLRALVDAYATACDNRDGEAFGSLFTPDATMTIYQPFETEPLVTLEGADAMPNAIAPLSQYRGTLHLMANHTAEVDGDSASGETYCLAHHLRPTDEGGVEDLVMMIRYGDRYARAGDRWQFAHRDVRILWTEIHPASGDPIPF